MQHRFAPMAGLMPIAAVAVVVSAMAAFAGAAHARHWLIPQHLTWYWQLTGHVHTSIDAEAYDIDGFETPPARSVRCIAAAGT